MRGRQGGEGRGEGRAGEDYAALLLNGPLPLPTHLLDLSSLPVGPTELCFPHSPPPPCRQLAAAPLQTVQSGLDSAQNLLRMATSPEFDLPAVEANAMWMLTTYLDDTLRVSRDDQGATFVMLKDV